MRTLHERPRLLTYRELQVLQGIANLKQPRQVAAELELSPRTVKEYIDSARRVVGAKNRYHLIAIGLREGWLV